MRLSANKVSSSKEKSASFLRMIAPRFTRPRTFVYTVGWALVIVFFLTSAFLRTPLRANIEETTSDEILDLRTALDSANLENLQPKRVVDLSENKLKTLPSGFIHWSRNEIHTLYLSGNHFDAIPDLSALTNLKMLSMRRNALKRVNCNHLPVGMVHLILTDNIIDGFDGDCSGRLSHLNKLMMARNRLQSFPERLNLPSLELIRLPQNKLRELPRNLLNTSPLLKWASFAENPCCPEPAVELPKLGMIRCESYKELGSGTSGVALLCEDNSLVFKRFKALSTDGSADAEMRISALLPKNHPNILAPLGTAYVSESRDDRAYGLVFPFIDALPAGLPPQFGSEDRFPASKQHRFAAQRVLQASRQLACALADMHDAGVAHMDLYAHNTLLSNSRAVFLDFGAATCLKALTKADAALLIKLDLRALGNLIKNLLAFVVDDTDGDPASAKALGEIIAKTSDLSDSRALCNEVSLTGDD